MQYVEVLSLINKENKFSTETFANTRGACVEIVEMAV